jgi:curved DNA-binding protein CbpA
MRDAEGFQGLLDALRELVQQVLLGMLGEFFPNKTSYRERHGTTHGDGGSAAGGGERGHSAVDAAPEKPNPFDVLGIPRETTDLVTVKKAFHKLARKWHPDKNPGNEAKEKMQKLNEAYSACLDALGDGESDDEDDRDEQEERPAASASARRASASARRDEEDRRWKEAEREFRRWRKVQKDQEKKLRREMEKSEKRQCREDEWAERLRAVGTMKRQEALLALRKLGGKCGNTVYDPASDSWAQVDTVSVSQIQEQLRIAISAACEAEQKTMERDKLHVEKTARAKAEKMKRQQLLYEVKKAGLQTTGEEAHEELVSMLHAHLDQQSEARTARIGKPRPLMDNSSDDWACAVRIDALDALLSRIANEDANSLCQGLDEDENSLLHYCMYYNRRRMVEIIIRNAGEEWWRLCLVENMAGETAASLGDDSQTLGPWMRTLESQARDAQTTAEAAETVAKEAAAEGAERTVDMAALCGAGVALLCVYFLQSLQQQLHSGWDWAVLALWYCLPLSPGASCGLLLAYRLAAPSAAFSALQWIWSTLAEYSTTTAIVGGSYFCWLSVLAAAGWERARKQFIEQAMWELGYVDRAMFEKAYASTTPFWPAFGFGILQRARNHVSLLAIYSCFFSVGVTCIAIEQNARVPRYCAGRLRDCFSRVPIVCRCIPFVVEQSSRIFTAKVLTFASFEVTFRVLFAVGAWYLGATDVAENNTAAQPDPSPHAQAQEEDIPFVDEAEVLQNTAADDELDTDDDLSTTRTEYSRSDGASDETFLSDEAMLRLLHHTETLRHTLAYVIAIVVAFLLSFYVASFLLRREKPGLKTVCSAVWSASLRILRSGMGCATAVLRQISSTGWSISKGAARGAFRLVCLPFRAVQCVASCATSCRTSALSVCTGVSMAVVFAVWRCPVALVKGVAHAFMAVVHGGSSLLSVLCGLLCSSTCCKRSHADVEPDEASLYAELSDLLNQQGCSKYLPVFIEHEVTFDALCHFEEDDLKELGIAKGPRVKILTTMRAFAGSGLTVPQAAATAAAPEPAPAAVLERPSCSICMEPYSAAGGVVPRMLVACGHDFCEGCLDKMLLCAAAIRAIACLRARLHEPCNDHSAASAAMVQV